MRANITRNDLLTLNNNTAGIFHNTTSYYPTKVKVNFNDKVSNWVNQTLINATNMNEPALWEIPAGGFIALNMSLVDWNGTVFENENRPFARVRNVSIIDIK
jgi:hypothetical protein